MPHHCDLKMTLFNLFLATDYSGVYVEEFIRHKVKWCLTIIFKMRFLCGCFLFPFRYDFTFSNKVSVGNPRI